MLDVASGRRVLSVGVRSLEYAPRFWVFGGFIISFVVFLERNLSTGVRERCLGILSRVIAGSFAGTLCSVA